MLSNFFTGTENLFKLLFVNGILIILIGLFYPLQKRDELELKIIEYNSNVSLLNRDIKELYSQSDLLKTEIKQDLVKNKGKKNNSPELKKKSVELKAKIFEQDKKVIQIENDKGRLEILRSQQETYNKYCKAFLFFGGLITITGLSGWSRLTYFMYDKEYSDFKQRSLQSDANLVPTRFKRHIILTIIIIILLVASLFYILFS